MDEGDLEQEVIFKRIRDLMAECNSSGYIHWEALSRPNENISYGAWDWALKSRYVNFNYVFVAEDDYVPSLLEFDREVLNRYFSDEQARKEVVKVVGLWVGDQSGVPCRVAEKDKIMSEAIRYASRSNKSHAAVAHGVVNVAVYNLLGGFRLPASDLIVGRMTGTAARLDSCMIQQLYLKNYTEAGYKVLSMAEHYSVPYSECPGVIHHFGVDGAPAVFVPCELEVSGNTTMLQPMKDRLQRYCSLQTEQEAWGGEHSDKIVHRISSNDTDWLDSVCEFNAGMSTNSNAEYGPDQVHPDRLLIHNEGQKETFCQLTGLEVEIIALPDVGGLGSLATHKTQDDRVVHPTAYRIGYYMHTVLNNSSPGDVVLEIGGGWGLLAALTITNADRKYVICDIPSTISTAASFLSLLGKKVCLPVEHDEKDMQELVSEYDVVFIEQSQFSMLQSVDVGCAVSTACLPELPRDYIDFYLSGLNNIRPGCIYIDYTTEARGLYLEGSFPVFDEFYTQSFSRRTPINCYIPWTKSPDYGTDELVKEVLYVVKR
jgi:hypothetical protein